MKFKAIIENRLNPYMDLTDKGEVKELRHKRVSKGEIKAFVACLKVGVGIATKEDKELAVTVNRQDFIGNKRLLKAAKEELLKIGANEDVLRAVINIQYVGNDNASSEELYGLVNEEKHGTRIPVKAYNILPTPKSGERSVVDNAAYNAVSFYKIANTSGIVRKLIEIFKYDEDTKGGYIGSTFEKNVFGKYELVGGSYASFGTEKVSKVPKALMYLEFGTMIQELGHDNTIVKVLWKDVHEKGIIELDGMVYPFSEERSKMKGAKHFVIANETPSGLKNGSILMVQYEGFDDPQNLHLNLLDELDHGMVSIIEESFKKDKASKYVKRIYSACCANAIVLGSINFKKYSILVKKNPFKDGRDLNVPDGVEITDKLLDGQSIGRGSYYHRMAQKKYPEYKGSLYDTMMAAQQARPDFFAGKTNMNVYPDEAFDLVVEVCENDPDFVKYGNGPVVMIGDSDVFKLFGDWLDGGKVVNSEEMTVNLMNLSHSGKTTVNVSSQLSNKIRDRKRFNNFVCNRFERNLVNEFAEKVNPSSAPRDLDGKNCTFSEVIRNVYKEDAINTTPYMRDAGRTAVSKIEKTLDKGSVEIGGMTLAVSMEAFTVMTKGKAPSLLRNGSNYLEFYSCDLLKNYKSLFSRTNNDLKVTSIKYPSQGTEEHIPGRIVTLEEMLGRIVLLYSQKIKKGEMTVEEAVKYAKAHALEIKYHGSGCILMANSNVAAIWLAGFDKDFDKLCIITDEEYTDMIEDKIENDGGLFAVLIINKKKKRDNSKSIYRKK